MNRVRINKAWLLVLSLLAGIILALAWPSGGFPGLLFIAFVPFLFIEDHISTNPEKFSKFGVFFYTYPGFFVWNLTTTWWIVNSTGVGALLAIVLNALFMGIVFQLFHVAKKHLPKNKDGKISVFPGFALLFFLWIAFEYLHLNWDLNWPWLNLGNGFAAYHKWVQWYEYTGALGGTAWVLVANMLCFLSLPVKENQVAVRVRLVLPGLLVLWIGLPIGYSCYRYSHYAEKPYPVNVVVVQPNVDPYSEQYSMPPREVISRIMNLGTPLIDSTTNFFVAPESAIQEKMWENDMSTFESLNLLRQVIDSFPNLNIIIGGSTFRAFEEGEKISRTARRFLDVDKYYDAYNAAIMINRNHDLQLYHKSKLTPGVEILPSFRKFKFIEKFAIDLGGTVGSLGTDSVRLVYRTVGTVPGAAVICYESVFGEFFARFVRNGAEVMFIITNDGWWGNTPGHRQHFDFASIRAIETRRSIARSANTGISAFTNQRGDDLDVTEYWKPDAIKGTINANKEITFYVKHGDYIARISAALSILILTFVFFKYCIRKLKNPKTPKLNNKL